MYEQDLREVIAEVKAGRLSRRTFTRRLVGLGLSAPFASQLLVHAGLARSPSPVEYKPTRARGGALKTLFWQAPTLLNPHFAVGAKDAEGAGIFYEPLAAWDSNGNLVPVLAAEIPDIENGGVAADGMSVTWKLKTGVQWHDGRSFTADDVVFNGYMPPIRQRPPRRSAATKMWKWKRSMHLPCAFTFRNRRRSGQAARTA
jgi:peptide/nickel transport system substrate-binding protein